MYGRFENPLNGKIYRLLTGKSVNRIPLRIWRDTAVTLKVVRPKYDVEGIPITYPVGVPVRHNIRDCTSENKGNRLYRVLYTD